MTQCATSFRTASGEVPQAHTPHPFEIRHEKADARTHCTRSFVMKEVSASELRSAIVQECIGVAELAPAGFARLRHPGHAPRKVYE